MNRKCILLAAMCVSPLVLWGCNGNSDKEAKQLASADQREPFSVLESAELQVVAPVQSVDYAARRITLLDSCGAAMEFAVSDQVKRLNEIKPGDKVKIKSTVAVLAEVRPPTAEEAAHPIASVSSGERGGAGSAPMAMQSKGLRVVTTVTNADPQTMQVTLKGPHGDSTTFTAKRPENVKRLRTGDTVVLTYWEAVAGVVIPAE
jgi:Cu/Ag efflux protein CusF